MKDRILQRKYTMSTQTTRAEIQGRWKLAFIIQGAWTDILTPDCAHKHTVYTNLRMQFRAASTVWSTNELFERHGIL
jgi:hypothetical protein